MSALPWTDHDANGVSLEIDLAIYPLDVVLRACHAFTGRCYVFPRIVDSGKVSVHFAARDAREPLRDLAGAFANALLDHALRVRIANETKTIRELLVAQAFCEADLLDRAEVEGDEYDDPRGIAR